LPNRRRQISPTSRALRHNTRTDVIAERGKTSNEMGGRRGEGVFIEGKTRVLGKSSPIRGGGLASANLGCIRIAWQKAGIRKK